jgi:hypothetical protein
MQSRRLESDRIRTWTASVAVLTVPVVNEVASLSARHAILSTACSDALQIVGPGSTGQGVITRVTDEHITTTTASESIVASLPEHRIVALASADLIVPAATAQAVIAPEAAAEDVVASQAIQDVLAS